MFSRAGTIHGDRTLNHAMNKAIDGLELVIALEQKEAMEVAWVKLALEV